MPEESDQASTNWWFPGRRHNRSREKWQPSATLCFDYALEGAWLPPSKWPENQRTGEPNALLSGNSSTRYKNRQPRPSPPSLSNIGMSLLPELDIFRGYLKLSLTFWSLNISAVSPKNNFWTLWNLSWYVMTWVWKDKIMDCMTSIEKRVEIVGC